MVICQKEKLIDQEYGRFQELVLDKKIDINFPVVLTKFTPLLALCRYSKSSYLMRFIKMFLARGDVNLAATTHCGHNALALLCRYYPHGDLMRLIRLLIHHGINCNVLDRNHRPTYLLVCEWYLCEDLLDVARLLLKTVDSVNPEAAGKSLTLLRNRGLQHESEILLNLIK